MDFRSASHIEEALARLGELLAAEAESVTLLVCGGASLIVQRLVPRTTHDVDVLACMTAGFTDPPAAGTRQTELPAAVQEMALAVAADLGLDDDWLNLGPSSIVTLGLPDGLMNRTVRRDYGAGLTVLYVGRVDQIHLKLYAALSREERHVQDLVALHPTSDELMAAKEWIETVVGDAVLPSDVANLLRDLGHDNIIH